MAELLNYLVVANTEQKANLVPKIMTLVEKFSPNKKWRVDTIITMLSIAGAAVDESVPRLAIVFIAQSEGLQGYIAHRLFKSIQEDTSSPGLLIVALWCIGEYGNQLTRPYSSTDPSDPSSYSAIPESEIVALLDKCSRLHNSDAAIKAVILNSLMKLSTRLSPSSRSNILDIIKPYHQSMFLELQQRSIEYSMLLSPRWDNLRGELLGSMPILDEAAMQKRKGGYEEGKGIGSGQSTINTSLPIPAAIPSASSGGVSLLDLDDIFGGGSAKPPTPALTPSNFTSQPIAPTTDLLSDIFSMTSITPTPTPVSVAPIPTSAISSMGLGLDISPKPMNPIIKAYDKAGFQVSMELSKPNNSDPSVTRITCRFYNLTSTPMDSLVFQAAVPKYLKLEMMAASSTTIPPGSSGVVTQEIRLTNSMQGEKNIMLKLKIGYNHGGHTVEEQSQVSNFPERY
jgi:AP-1 complex subunit gamma-1